MKRLFIAILLLTIMVPLAFAWTAAWDEYTDSTAQLRIYQSDDQVNWAIIVDNIPYTYQSSEVPAGTRDTRIYYRMTAFNSDLESAPSNTISLYWNRDGVGFEGPAAVGNLYILDCEPYDLIEDDESYEWAVCNARYNK